MIKLHGILLSNYYSLAKACFIEKGKAFEEVKDPPSQQDDYLARSPMGKVPCIEVDGTFLSEAFAIADYLDHIQPDPPLLPGDPLARAKNIELIRHLELNVELVARRCLPEAFFGQSVSDETKAATKKDLAKGMRAVGNLLECGPYAAGETFTLADLYVFYTFGLASMIVKKIFDEDLLGDVPEVKVLLETLAARDSIREVEAAKSR